MKNENALPTTPQQRSSKVGYWIDFSRGWHADRDGRSHKEQSAGMYHGSVTEEQAKELEQIVKDYLETRAQPPRLTAYGMRGFIERAIAYWKNETGDHAKKQADEMQAMLERTPSSERKACDDTRRLDFLAEITNISALRGWGAMLDADKVRKFDKAAEILHTRYEIHRRAVDTPEAFRRAVDEAIKETGHGRT